MALRWVHRAGAALVAALTGTLGVVSGPAQAEAGAGCRVTYEVNDWGGGFTADIVVTNRGNPLSSWTLEWSFASGQRISTAWNSTVVQSGARVTLRNAAWNGELARGGTARAGFLASYPAGNATPADFLLNGVSCSETVDQRPDNPFATGAGYVNPEWKAKAEKEPGGSRISSTPTAVWLDSTGSIGGLDPNGRKVSMGLREHLDAALAQGAAYVQFVIYNLPARNCAKSKHSEFTPGEVHPYKEEFVDPIAAIQHDPKYRDLRIVNIVEPGSLADLVVYSSGTYASYDCTVMWHNGGYVKGIAYALDKLGGHQNVYNYLDAGSHDVLGHDVHGDRYAATLAKVTDSAVRGKTGVTGFAVNVAGYGPTVEPFLTVTDTVGGERVKDSTWVAGNRYVDAQGFAAGLRARLVAAGFDPSIGMLIDTSRNGWGGPDRPTARSTSTQLNTYVDESRVDRRISPANWCNQRGAGLGERPVADPAPGVHAYAWIKPPGESDGSHLHPIMDSPTSFGVYRMCDPDYPGVPRGGQDPPTGALPDAPAQGDWFSAQFQELMRNAYPPL